MKNRIVLFMLGLSPSVAFAYDKDILSIWIGVPICIVSFFVCLIFSVFVKSKDKLVILLLLSSPSWLFVLKFLTIAIDPDYRSFSPYLLTITGFIIAFTMIPLLIFKSRNLKTESTNSLGAEKKSE